MSTTAAFESRVTPYQFQSLDGPARPGPPTVISGGTSTSRTTDPTLAATPSRGAVLRKSTRDSTQMGLESMGPSGSNDETDPSTPRPDHPAHSDPLNSTSGGPSTSRITGFSRDEAVTTSTDSFSLDPALAAAPPQAPLLRRSVGEAQMGDGHTRDGLASGSNDESGIRLDDLGRSNPFTTTFPGRRDPAPAATSSPGTVLQRSPGDSTLMDMGNRLDAQANELRELSRRIAELEAKIAGGRSERPEVKLTPWRMLNTVFLLVVGAYKAGATYIGQTTGPTTADWILGVVWALITFWVTFYEALSEADEKLGHPSWFFTYDLSEVVYRNLTLLLSPFFYFMLLGVVYKIAPENPSWAFYFLMILITVVATVGYAVTVPLLPKLKLGKLLRQARLVQFLLDLFHGSDWSLARDIHFVITVIVGSFVQVSASVLFEPVRNRWWPFPMVDSDVLTSANYAGMFAVSVFIWYIVCGLLRMFYRLLRRFRGRSSSSMRRTLVLPPLSL